MKRGIVVLLALALLATGTAQATPKVEPATLAADLSFWGLDQGPPYPTLIFYEGNPPWMGWVGDPINYIYMRGGCGQKIAVFVPACTGCPSVCPAGRICDQAIVEGVANASGVYRVLRFTAGDPYWGSAAIPYTLDSGLLILQLPDLC
jgi:hypothetical protein